MHHLNYCHYCVTKDFRFPEREVNNEQFSHDNSQTFGQFPRNFIDSYHIPWHFQISRQVVTVDVAAYG